MTQPNTASPKRRAQRPATTALKIGVAAAAIIIGACSEQGISPTEPLHPRNAAFDATFDSLDIWSYPGAVRPDNAGSLAPVVLQAGSLANRSAFGSTASFSVSNPTATVRVQPLAPFGPVNCYPFGGSATAAGWGPSMGFIYRNIPAFAMNAGDKIQFDMGAVNNADIRREIYFSATNVNPSTVNGGQGIHATGWTKVVSNTQTPLNPRGNTVKGDFELTFTAETNFTFAGGGFAIGFMDGLNPAADPGCDQMLVAANSSDPSGFFYRRFYAHQALNSTDILDSGNGDNSSLAGFLITATGMLNKPPVVTLPGSLTGVEGSTIVVTATASDPDNDALTYKFDINGDGVIDSVKTTPSITLSFADQVTQTVKVTVDDGNGGTATAATVVTVTNAAPVITAITPATSIAVGGTFSLSASFSDAGVNDGPWVATIDWGDHTSEQVSVAAQATAIVASHKYATFGTYAASVTVRDKDNGTSSPSSVAVSTTDATPPVISEVVGGTVGQNGWFTGSVLVSFSVADPESGIASQNGCATTTLNSDTPSGGTTYTCTATNGAGLTATKSVTVLRDATPPVVTPVVSGTVGVAPWYTSDVAVSFVTTDAQSGIGTLSGCDATTVNTDGSQAFSCTATNAAGLSTVASVSVKRDASTPTVVPTANGPLNGVTGWYTGDASVTWAVTANGPSGVSAPCATANITTDTPGQTFTCVATSGAGRSATASISIKRDATIPTVTGAASGTKGSNDWFTSDATVHFAVSTGGISGITANCPDVLVNTDVASQAYSCSAVTGAGILAKTSVTVKRDASHPVVTATPSGTLGAGGWYTSDVSIGWNAAAAGPSGVTFNCPADLLSSNTTAYTSSCTATSGAGLPTTAATTVKRDATIPVVTGTPSGTLGDNGWYTSPVSVSWAVSAAGPSGMSQLCAANSLTTDVASQTYTCTMTTGAGKSGVANVTVKRDASAPNLSAAVAGTLGNNGWYRSDVTVSWSANDPTSSAPAVPCVANTLSTDNASTTYTCTAKNGAGLTTTVQQTVKRDATPPALAYSVAAGTYTVDQPVSITCSVSDPMSGIATKNCVNITGNGYDFALGTTNYSANATDNAGNSSSAHTSVTVSVTDASVCSLVQRFSSNAGVANSLCGKLTKGNYAPFRNELAAQTGKKISESDAAILLRLVNALDTP